MDLDGLRVDHAGLDRTADDLRMIVTRIDARMQLLDGRAGPAACAVGRRRASSRYVAAKARWDIAIHEMRDLLRLTSEQVAVSNAEYRAADARGARSFGG